jgi:hypothetical protein
MWKRGENLASLLEHLAQTQALKLFATPKPFKLFATANFFLVSLITIS